MAAPIRHPERDAEMERLYVHREWSALLISRAYGLSDTRVRQILIDRGVRMREANEMRLRVHTQNDIASTKRSSRDEAIQPPRVHVECAREPNVRV